MPPQIPQAGSNPVTAKDGTPLNPLAVNLAKAIRQTESGGDYTAVGDSGQSHGAYQFNKDNFQNWAKQYGLNPDDFSPTNQDKVAYARISSLLKDGKAPSEVAALWNGARVVNGKDVAINPDYVQKVKNNYAQIVGSQSSGAQTGYAAPTPSGQAQQVSQGNVAGYAPPTPPQISANSGGTPQQPQPENLLQKAGDVAKGVGNFLFPIVGDVYNDVTGNNKKTVLQQGGDLALSALPFIPGLGEVGLGAKAAEAGVEGARAAEGAGLLSKLAGSTAAKGALTGYGAGVASNLSQGQGLGQSFMPNASTIGGAVLGGAAPIVLGGVSKLARGISGIDPQVATELERMGTQANPADSKLYDQYISAAKTHASDLTAKSPLTLAADNLDTAASKLKQMYSEAGKGVGEANRAAEAVPLKTQDIAPIAENFNNELADRFGYKVAVTDAGNHVLVPTRAGAPALSATDKNRILDIAQRIDQLGQTGNVRMADDLMTQLDQKDIRYLSKKDDPLTGLFKQVRGQVNGVARQASPDFAAANDKASTLAKLIQEVKAMAGDKTQRGELLMRRVFSGDKSGDVQDLFNKIKQATGIDLVKQAVLARHAIQSYGSLADKTLLEKAIEGGIQAHTGGIIPAMLNAGAGAARSTFANPVKIGRKLVSGGRNGILPSLVTKAAIRTGSAL